MLVGTAGIELLSLGAAEDSTELVPAVEAAELTCAGTDGSELGSEEAAVEDGISIKLLEVGTAATMLDGIADGWLAIALDAAVDAAADSMLPIEDDMSWILERAAELWADATADADAEGISIADVERLDGNAMFWYVDDALAEADDSPAAELDGIADGWLAIELVAAA
jgi:hypothetical protein